METLATYAFLPWARLGISSRIADKDTLGLTDGNTSVRASLNADLEIKYTGKDNISQSAIISKSIKIVGPGDIANISSKNIVRTEPQNGVGNFEANLLPYIEFYDEDFPWRFTPANADNSNISLSRLRPWLTLVALRNEEFTLNQNPNGLPYITIKQERFNDAFPHEKDTWAFAHVHVNNHITNLNGTALQQEVTQLLSGNPDIAVSRLLCSRKLQKNTGYTAFLIPTFETGRLSGLGIDITGVLAQAPAWKKGFMPALSKRPFDFPLYYQWSFRTADLGDFEALATKLKPAIMDADSGKTPMDISSPGFNLAAANKGTKLIGMESALKPASMQKDSWPTNTGGSSNTDDLATVEKLKKLLNLSADLVDKNAVFNTNNPFFNTSMPDDPLLVPPVYGSWHALVKKLGDNSTLPWIETLNLDFRNRAAAGLGKKVVQQRQEDFMNRAWQQVNKVNEANKQIQQAALVSMVNTAILKKHIINGGPDKALVITSPVQHLVKNPARLQTVQQDFVDSRIPVAVKSAAFRKITRPNSRGPMASFVTTSLSSSQKTAQSITARNTAVVTPIKPTNILQRFNADPSVAGALAAATLKTAPGAAIQIGDVQQSMNNALVQYQGNMPSMATDEFFKLLQANLNPGSLTKQQAIQAANNMVIPVAAIKTELLDWINNITVFPLQRVNNQIVVQFTDAKFKQIFGVTVHAKKYNDIVLKDSTILTTENISLLSTLNDLKELNASVNLFQIKNAGIPVAGAVKPLNELEAVSKYVLDKINPTVTLTKKLASTIKIYQGGKYVPLQNLKTVMAYPEFTESVYTYLLELSKNHLLPNIDQLPANSITLLENNQSFIEAFMAGLNHEMARELLWREYPTDQRGSYFRQFWSVKDNIFPQSGDPQADKELKLDIKKIQEWNQPLGGNSPRTNGASLVLVIRGELLKKFPNAVIYAQQAEYDNDHHASSRKLKQGINPAFTKFPVFRAEINPDISLMGFDLTAEEAIGDQIPLDCVPTTGKNPGWFFVMKERPGQVRFGMDDYGDEHGEDSMPTAPPATWDDLSWQHLVANKNELLNFHINFNKSIGITNAGGQPIWASNSADMAAILFQDPVLVARHAAQMLSVGDKPAGADVSGPVTRSTNPINQ